jgi:cellulose 1,4-beta-cellobiosidase
LFGDYNDHDEIGGLRKMGEAMKKGMVLVMSLWDDHDANMVNGFIFFKIFFGSFIF